MDNKYYLDTSIWLDYYEKRGRNGELALALINKLIDKKELIIYSDMILMELKKLKYSEFEINEIFRVVKPILIRVHISREQKEETKRMKNYIDIPLKDIMHGILARDNEAIIVYTDKHFEKLKYLVEMKKPEELA